MPITKETTGGNAKQFIETYLWPLICITIALIAIVTYAIEGNWSAAIWALAAGMWVALSIRAAHRYNMLQEQFREYVAKTKAVK